MINSEIFQRRKIEIIFKTTRFILQLLLYLGIG